MREDNNELNKEERLNKYKTDNRVGLELEKLIAEASGDTRLMLSYEIDKFERKVKENILEDVKTMKRDLSGVINIIHQAEEMYDDIIKG